MRKVHFLRGLPASGKSTWAKEMVAAHPGRYKRINKDDLRAMLDVSHWSRDNEKFVKQVRNDLMLKALSDGKSVIIDDTNFHPSHLTTIQSLVKTFNQVQGTNIIVEVKDFDLPLDECIKRDLGRPNSVGEKVIRDMHDQYVKTPEASFAAKQDNSLPAAILVDLDGTLALFAGQRGPFDWDKVGDDKVNEPVASLVAQAAFFEGYKISIIILSGRDGVAKDASIEWLDKNAIVYDKVFMRAAGDTRKDSIVKRELYEKHIKDKYFVEFVLDDRDQVVDLWRKDLGLPCFQVNYGNF